MISSIHSSISAWIVHPSSIHPFIHHPFTKLRVLLEQIYLMLMFLNCGGTWRTPCRHQENVGPKSRIKPTTCWLRWACVISGNVYLTLPEETSVPVDCTHSLSTSGTDGTSFRLQQQEQNLSRTSTEQVAPDRTLVQLWLWHGFSCTSLTECEAGVVIATVSLFGAAGGVVLTAVAPDRWCWKTKAFILVLDLIQTAHKLDVFVAAQTQTDPRCTEDAIFIETTTWTLCFNFWW